MNRLNHLMPQLRARKKVMCWDGSSATPLGDDEMGRKVEIEV